MIGAEIKRIGFDFILCEEDFLIDVELDRVYPVAVVPDVEIFLIFGE
jgi:hypothetical protein